MGYTNVREYKGGKAEWIKSGLPIESGSAAQNSSHQSSGTIDASTEPQEGAA
jgi:hypothetical protein